MAISGAAIFSTGTRFTGVCGEPASALGELPKSAVNYKQTSALNYRRHSVDRKPSPRRSEIGIVSSLVSSLRSSSYRTLAVPRTRTTLGDRSFAVAGPRVWNSLPATIRQITSYGQLRQSQRIVTLDYCALCKYSYLLTSLAGKSS